VEPHGTATTDQFSILQGATTGQVSLRCNACVTDVELTATDPHAVTAEATLRKREHDADTCGANRSRPEWARRWTPDSETSRHNPVERAR
jgi:hypothetical protein